MELPVELFLALRYLRPRRTFVSVITVLSFLGVTLGVGVITSFFSAVMVTRMIVVLWLNLRRDPSIQDLHHSDITTYALTRLASQYAREKQEIIKDLRGYKSADEPAARSLASPEPTLSAAGYGAAATRPRGMDSPGKE